MNSEVRNFLTCFRGVRAAAVTVCALLVCSSAPAAVPVVSIEQTRVADVILLGQGFDAGLRQGMVCRVTRGAIEIAEILMVELRPTSSAALILSVSPKQ